MRERGGICWDFYFYFFGFSFFSCSSSCGILARGQRGELVTGGLGVPREIISRAGENGSGIVQLWSWASRYMDCTYGHNNAKLSYSLMC